MIKAQDYIGKKFHSLTIINKVENNHRGLITVLTKCDCGNEKKIPIAYIISGNNKSCGCHKLNTCYKNFHNKANHGLKNTLLYNVYCAIKGRCYNPNNKSYKDYGGRGITMCKEWKEDAGAFAKWCIANGYKEGLQIDRINNNGNYEPYNCRFVTLKENQNNKRTNRLITYNNITMSLSQWANIMGINRGTLKSRLTRNKWSIDKSLNTKVA